MDRPNTTLHASTVMKYTVRSSSLLSEKEHSCAK
jgi:hypothetical protein